MQSHVPCLHVYSSVNTNFTTRGKVLFTNYNYLHWNRIIPISKLNFNTKRERNNSLCASGRKLLKPKLISAGKVTQNYTDKLAHSPHMHSRQALVNNSIRLFQLRKTYLPLFVKHSQAIKALGTWMTMITKTQNASKCLPFY